jgi:hypothetical protein
VRRCESADIQGRIENPQIHDFYLGSDEIQALYLHFGLALEQYQSAKSKPSGDLSEIVTELENVRRRLASTALGIEFLIHRVNCRQDRSGIDRPYIGYIRCSPSRMRWAYG